MAPTGAPGLVGPRRRMPTARLYLPRSTTFICRSTPAPSVPLCCRTAAISALLMAVTGAGCWAAAPTGTSAPVNDSAMSCTYERTMGLLIVFLVPGCQGLVDQRLERRGDRRVRILLDHDDRDQLLLRIDPEIGAVDPAPAKHAFRSERLRRGQICDDAEAEPEADARAEQEARGCQVAGVAGRHQLDALRAEQSDAVDRTAARQQQREPRVVANRRRQPRAARKVPLARLVVGKRRHVRVAERLRILHRPDP